MIIRKTFPQVYALESPDKGKYWLVSARSAKWGLNERKTFATEKEALDYARQVEKRIQHSGAQTNIPKEMLARANAYGKLVERLTNFGKTPEDAVDHYVRALADCAL